MPSILRAVFGERAAYDSGPWGSGMIRYGSGTSAPATDDETMRLSAVFACIRLLSEAIATMPLDTFVRSGGTRRPFRPRPDYLTFQPPSGSRIEYLSQVMLSLLTDGNAYVATPRDEVGEPQALVPIEPCLVKVGQDDRGGMTYEIGGERFGPLDILHIKAMTLPGAIKGLSPLGYARETAELGLSAQRFGSAFFANGALPAGVVEAPGEFSRANAERMSALWDARHRGVANASKVGVLTGGAKFNRITIDPEQAQFLQTRQFQVPDICRFFGVPPHLVADASNSTSWGSGLAEQNLAFGQFSLRPWVDRIEDAHGRLLSTHGLPDVFVRLNMDALLRAGTKERYDAYAVAIQNKVMLTSEVRTLEDLPPLEELSAPDVEIATALEWIVRAPSLAQNPGIPTLVNQLRVLNGKAPLGIPQAPPTAQGTAPLSPAQETTP